MNKNIVLLPLDASNWLDVCKLSVSEDQKNIFPIPNVYFIGISRYEEMSELFAIVVDNVSVGLIGGGYDEDGVTGYINPLMIDAKYQGNGYARQGLKFMIQYLQDKLHVTEIHINHRKENVIAGKLYESMGFSIYDEDQSEFHRKLLM